MAAFYSIIQFIPDPVAEERINAGVVVFDDRGVRARFIENWARLQRFANHDIGFLKKFAREFLERSEASRIDGRITEQSIREMVAWRGHIQMTPPRGSLLGLEELLADAEERFLANDRRTATRPYTRHHMKKLVLEATRLAFIQRGGLKAKELVKRDFSIAGDVENHPFSLAIVNGRPMVAAEVFSFVGTDQRGQEKDVRATAWAFGDVRKRHRDLALTALVLPGDQATQALEDASKIFRSLGVEVVPRESVEEWAERTADRILRAA